MTNAQTFIINATTGSLVGIVGNAENITTFAEGNLVVTAASDLMTQSLGQLTAIYNAVSGESKGTFKVAKTKAAELVFSKLTSTDIAQLVLLDKVEEKVVEAAVVAVVIAEATAPAVRKVRDSKLQRMAAAFRSTDEAGVTRPWTIKELMEKCGTTEKITHQYISILRAHNDRFVMEIVKDKATNTFLYIAPKAVAQELQAA